MCIKSALQLSVESNVAFILLLFPLLHPVCQPMRRENQIETQSSRFPTSYAPVTFICLEFSLILCPLCVCGDWLEQLLWFQYIWCQYIYCRALTGDTLLIKLKFGTVGFWEEGKTNQNSRRRRTDSKRISPHSQLVTAPLTFAFINSFPFPSSPPPSLFFSIRY